MKKTLNIRVGHAFVQVDMDGEAPPELMDEETHEEAKKEPKKEIKEVAA